MHVQPMEDRGCLQSWALPCYGKSQCAPSHQVHQTASKPSLMLFLPDHRTSLAVTFFLQSGEVRRGLRTWRRWWDPSTSWSLFLGLEVHFSLFLKLLFLWFPFSLHLCKEFCLEGEEAYYMLSPYYVWEFSLCTSRSTLCPAPPLWAWEADLSSQQQKTPLSLASGWIRPSRNPRKFFPYIIPISRERKLGCYGPSSLSMVHSGLAASLHWRPQSSQKPCLSWVSCNLFIILLSFLAQGGNISLFLALRYCTTSCGFPCPAHTFKNILY